MAVGGGKKPFKRGINFKNGKLYRFICGHERKSEGVIEVIRPWPPTAWTKRDGKFPWKHSHSQFALAPSGDLSKKIQRMEFLLNLDRDHPQTAELIKKQGFARRASLFRRLAETKASQLVPSEVRKRVRRYTDNQWNILSLLARGGEAAVELVDLNPALAYMLSMANVFHKPKVTRPWRAVRSLLKKKQREILLWLGFPGTRSVVRLLKKIPACSCRMLSFYYLRETLDRPREAEMLKHVSQLNVGALRIVTDTKYSPLVTANLISQLANMKEEKVQTPFLRLLKDTLQMRQFLNRDRRENPYESVAQVQREHDRHIRWVNDDRKSKVQALKNLTFPPPPIEGNQYIKPLLDSRAMLAEGQREHNCVSAYSRHEDVGNTRYYYHAEYEGERATLLLLKHDKNWVLDEMKSTNNREPSGRIRDVVDEWLYAGQPQFTFLGRLIETYDGEVPF